MILLILLTVLSWGFCSPVLQEPPLQQSPSPWFMMFEEKSAHGDRVQFLRAQKKNIDVWKLQYPDVPVFAWQNDDNTLYRVIPLISFASIDTLYRQMKQVSKSIKARNRYMDEQPGSLPTVSGTVMVWVPELSHRREAKFSLNPDEPFTKWMFVYLLSGQEEAAVEALTNYRDYYADKKLDYPWDTFRVLLGNETPVMIGMFRAGSPSALQTKGNKIWEKHGDELRALWEAVVQHTWKIENKTGWFNSSLSNVPDVEPVEEVAGELQVAP